ncbi:MAG: hypothetical protein M1819_001081 [Sarea resinae]|nr:MAG: hypothetical protein M1819_001081 [Sarea resinae]
MARDNFTPENLIARLSWRPDYIQDSMISIFGETIQSTELPRTSTPRSPGPLDALPIELQHIILNLLDFQSLSRLTRVCRRGKQMVESLPAHRDLVKHASSALIALSRTRLLTCHSAAALYAALLSEQCICCGNYAPFLFLPTCERCCYRCLERDRSLRMLTVRMAKVYFGVSTKHLNQIPIMLSIPGTYSVGFTVSRRRRLRLVSQKQVRQLSLAVHGSQEAMESFLTSQNAGKLTSFEMFDFQWLTDPSSGSQSGWSTNYPNDQFCGMASTCFPSLRLGHGLQRGLWCVGCRLNLEHYSRTGIWDAELLPSLPLNAHPTRPLLDLQHRARSKSELLEHIWECKGARGLLQRLEQEDKESGKTAEL